MDDFWGWNTRYSLRYSWSFLLLYNNRNSSGYSMFQIYIACLLAVWQKCYLCKLYNYFSSKCSMDFCFWVGIGCRFLRVRAYLVHNYSRNSVCCEKPLIKRSTQAVSTLSTFEIISIFHRNKLLNVK